MRCLNFACWSALVLAVCTAEVGAQGFGSRIANLPIFQRDDNRSGNSSTRNPRTARVERPATPTPPRQSEMTFAPSPLAPDASVTMPSPTSPAGPMPAPTANAQPRFGSRLWGAATAAREALTIKPREVPMEGPLSLTGTPDQVEAPVYIAAARVFEGQGRMDRAREQYEKALVADPKSFDALVGFARLQHREGDLVAATNLYHRALKAHPNNPVALNDLGLCYARRGMLPQAEQALAAAVRHAPRSKLYRNNLALVLVEANREEEALTQLNAVHGEAVAHYNLAYMLSEKGRPEEAAQHLQAALQLEPALEPARQMLATLQRPAPNWQTGGHLGRPQLNAPAQQQPQHVAPSLSVDGATRSQMPYREASPVRLRIEDRSPQANPHYNEYQPRAEPAGRELRRAPVPGDLPNYLRNNNPSSPSDEVMTNPLRSGWGN